MTSWYHDRMTNNHFWAYTWKQKLFSMSLGSTLSIWHMTSWHYEMKTWQHDKQSLLSLHMKTKVVQHVPGINIKHLTYDIMTLWHHDKQSLLSLHMKTHATCYTLNATHSLLHAPCYTLHTSRVTLSIWHMTVWQNDSMTTDQHDHRSASQHDNRLA